MRAEAEASSSKSDPYYGSVNKDILELVPAGAKRVLDVGCASGALGKEIKAKHPGTIVHGIERADAPLAAAQANLDRVFPADLEKGIPELDGPYDVIIFGDVLEHLVDPWNLLRALSAHLSPEGRVIASIPNLRYYKVVRDLVLKGRFTYRESGILDSTHLRFFTRHEMEKLFARAGLDVVDCKARLHGGNVLLWLADTMLFGALREFRVVQFVLVGRRQPEAARSG